MVDWVKEAFAALVQMSVTPEHKAEHGAARSDSRRVRKGIDGIRCCSCGW